MAGSDCLWAVQDLGVSCRFMQLLQCGFMETQLTTLGEDFVSTSISGSEENLLYDRTFPSRHLMRPAMMRTVQVMTVFQLTAVC